MSGINLLEMKSILEIHPSPWENWRPSRGNLGSFDEGILGLVTRFANSKCLDPHDKIYALQSLLHPTNRCEVDYNCKLNSLYWQVLISHGGLSTYLHAKSLLYALNISWDDVANGLHSEGDEAWQRDRSIIMAFDWDQTSAVPGDQHMLVHGSVDPADWSLVLVDLDKDIDSVSLVFPPALQFDGVRHPKGVVIPHEVNEYEQESGRPSEEWFKDVAIEATDGYATNSGLIRLSPLTFQNICSLQRRYDCLRNKRTAPSSTLGRIESCTEMDDWTWDRVFFLR